VINHQNQTLYFEPPISAEKKFSRAKQHIALRTQQNICISDEPISLQWEGT
jgi:hypothetical protein